MNSLQRGGKGMQVRGELKPRRHGISDDLRWSLKTVADLTDRIAAERLERARACKIMPRELPRRLGTASGPARTLVRSAGTFGCGALVEGVRTLVTPWLGSRF